MLQSLSATVHFIGQDDGVMFPSHASLYAAPVQLDSYMGDLVGCWSNVYGFDMTPMAQKAVEDQLSGKEEESIFVRHV